MGLNCFMIGRCLVVLVGVTLISFFFLLLLGIVPFKLFGFVAAEIGIDAILLRVGGGIVCILNAETLKNPYSAERKAIVQKLEDNNADIEYIQEAFIDGERKTNVEIALIRVKMPETERTSIILDGMRRAAAYAEDTAKYSETHVAEKDLMQSYVRQFNAEVEAGIRLINEYRAMQPFLLSEFEKDPESGKTVRRNRQQ